MRNKLSLIILSFFFFAHWAVAQVPDGNKNKAIEDLIEEIASNSDEELDYTALYDDLNYFFNNPLNLNEATEADLERLQFLKNNSIVFFI